MLRNNQWLWIAKPSINCGWLIVSTRAPTEWELVSQWGLQKGSWGPFQIESDATWPLCDGYRFGFCCGCDEHRTTPWGNTDWVLASVFWSPTPAPCCADAKVLCQCHLRGLFRTSQIALAVVLTKTPRRLLATWGAGPPSSCLPTGWRRSQNMIHHILI